MSTYGQFCPVAKAMELLDERWTLLVVRELLKGSAVVECDDPMKENAVTLVYQEYQVHVRPLFLAAKALARELGTKGGWILAPTRNGVSPIGGSVTGLANTMRCPQVGHFTTAPADGTSADTSQSTQM